MCLVAGLRRSVRGVWGDGVSRGRTGAIARDTALAEAGRPDFHVSPHARGPLSLRLRRPWRTGNNPARAGTTRPCPERAPRRREQPRTRGDHIRAAASGDNFEGTTPHARGPHPRSPTPARRAGTTPHARGPLRYRAPLDIRAGNNPARAGTTSDPAPAFRTDREKPRTRGDHRDHLRDFCRARGTTPHARGPPAPDTAGHAHLGNNPARAGTTACRFWHVPHLGEQPRTRGDHGVKEAKRDFEAGTTPHARGPP